MTDDRPAFDRNAAILATAENFAEVAYLAANPDVAAAVAAEDFASGREHFDLYGQREGRLMYAPTEDAVALAGGKHPLAGLLRASHWHLLHHYIDELPDLRPPILQPNRVEPGDEEICARLIAAFARAELFERDSIAPEKRPNDGLWESFRQGQHREALRLLATGDVAGLAAYLANGIRTSLCIGLGPGPVIFTEMSGAAWRGAALTIVDRLAALAEAVGVFPVENPEQGPYGASLRLDPADIVRAVEHRIGFSLHRPPVMGMYGLDCNGGIIDLRVPDDGYCAHRLAGFCDLARTRLVEIGGGFGGMALFALRAGATDWTIVDLPILNVLQGYFLIKCLGADAVRLFGENGPAAVTVLPYWEFSDHRREFTVVFNRDSLPEIQQSRVEEYLEEIEARGVTLFSINQEAGAEAGRPGLHQLNIHRLIRERSAMTCRARHPYWIRKGYVEEIFTPKSATSRPAGPSA